MKDLLKNFIRNNNRVHKAFWVAYRAHQGQYRKSGELYIIHPIEVATMLLECGYSDEDMLIAALLHDVVEDTTISIEDIYEEFGEVVAFLVEGLTKDHKWLYENKLISFAHYDKRIAVIKAFDRIHNLKTIRYLKPAKQKQFVIETRGFYISFIKNYVDNPEIIKCMNELIS